MPALRAAAAAAILFAIVLTRSEAAPTLSVQTVGDDQPFASGHYMAFIAPFNKGSLVFGTDYTEDISVDPSKFPGSSTLSWQWPEKPCPIGIYVFSAVDYGDYDNTVEKIPIPSQHVSAIKKLVETHYMTLAGALQGFDVVDDFFLSTSPRDNSTNVDEIEIFYHTPKYTASYVLGSAQLGSFTSSKVTWTVAKSTSTSGNISDYLFMPSDQADILRGSIDIKLLLDWLAKQDQISPDAYFNGLAVGAEVQAGGGRLKFNQLSMSYE